MQPEQYEAQEGSYQQMEGEGYPDEQMMYEQGYEDSQQMMMDEQAMAQYQVQKEVNFQHDFNEVNMENFEQIEQDVLEYCTENNCLWEDPDFPPTDASLWRDPENPPDYAQDTVPHIEWRRPNECFPKVTIKFCLGDKNKTEMKPGAIGHTWFMGAIAIITSKGDIIEKLFVDSSHFDLGFVSFQFFKNGEWKQVMVDTALPFDVEQNILVYFPSPPPNPTQLLQLLHDQPDRVLGAAPREGLREAARDV
jgi:hypothetical protein